MCLCAPFPCVIVTKVQVNGKVTFSPLNMNAGETVDMQIEENGTCCVCSQAQQLTSPQMQMID